MNGQDNESFASVFARRRESISNIAAQTTRRSPSGSAGFGERDPGKKEEVFKALVRSPVLDDEQGVDLRINADRTGRPPRRGGCLRSIGL